MLRVPLFVAGLAFFSQLAIAADVTEPPTEVTLDEVQVRAARMRLDEMRQELSRLEEQIYARYNEVNTVEKFDVICSDYTRTGTRLSERYCRPVFEERVRNEESQVAGRALQRINDPYSKVPPASVELPEPPVPKILAQLPAYQKHMRRVMETDAQLKKLLRERAAVAEDYQRARREKFDQ